MRLLVTPIRPDSVRLILGDDSGIYISRGAEYVIALRHAPFLSIKVNNDGTLLFDTQVIDSNNNKIVKVEDNVFKVNPAYAFRPRQLNKYSLIVQDWNGIDVLNIKYFNSETLWITGKFFSPDAGDTIKIHPSGEIEGFKGMMLRGIYIVRPNYRGGIIDIGGQQ